MSNPVFDSPDKLFAIALLDQFTTNDATPVESPRVCEPGPGILVFEQATSTLSISGGALQVSPPVPVSATTQGFYSSRAFRRVAGLALIATYTETVGQIYLPAWSNKRQIPGGGLYTDVEYMFRIFNNNIDAVVDIVKNTALYSNPLYPGNQMKFAIVLRSSGAFFLMNGGDLPDWTLFYVEDTKSARKVYCTYANVDSTGELGGIQVARWTTNGWDTDYGIVTNRSVSPTSGTSLVSTSDPLVKFTWTPVAAEVLEIDVRYTNNDNRWIVRCDQIGGTIKLIERNAGVETERISAAQTWTAGVPITIVAHARSFIWRIYADTVFKGVHGNSFNQAATTVRVSGFATGANFEAWPSYPTVPAISI